MAVREKLRLHWMLLLVAATAVVPSNANYGPNQIKFMVQNIVEPFIHFPQTHDHPKGTQFAVLTLISQQDYANGKTNIQLYPTPSQTNIDNRNSVQPAPQARVNYMVARPDTEKEAGGRKLREHAEKKLLDNFKQLLQNFERYNGPPAMVLLYTWFTPCIKCTEEILGAYNILREKYGGAGTPFIVTYSIEGAQSSKRPMSKSAENIQRLKRNGINVIHVNIPMNGGQGGDSNSGGNGGGGIGGGGIGGGGIGGGGIGSGTLGGGGIGGGTLGGGGIGGGTLGGGGIGSGTLGGGGIGGKFNFGAGGLGGRHIQPYSSTSINNNLLPRNGLWNFMQTRMRPTLGGPDNRRPSTTYYGRVGQSPLQPNINRPYEIQTNRGSMLQNMLRNRLRQRMAMPARVLSKLPFGGG